jgi:hypothetical protein
MNYPLITELMLGRPDSRRFRRPRREDVPDLPPGATYVFRVSGNYREYPIGTVFDPSHDDVLDASSVSLVDLRVRIVPVDWAVPSISEAGRFTLRASFTCQVTDPVAVARYGITDITAPLGAYLRRDAKLAGAGMAHTMDEVNVVREQITNRMKAYSAINPPDVQGMAIEFLAVEVLTPDDVAQHERDRLEVDREQELNRLRNSFEDDNTQRLVGLIEQGSSWVDALALARDRIDIADLASQRHKEEEAVREREAEKAALAASRSHEAELQERNLKSQLVLRLLQQMGGSDSYVDYHQVLQQVLEDHSGRPGADTSPAALGSGQGGRSTAFTKSPRGENPQEGFISDEDELLD